MTKNKQKKLSEKYKILTYWITLRLMMFWVNTIQEVLNKIFNFQINTFKKHYKFCKKLEENKRQDMLKFFHKKVSTFKVSLNTIRP